MIKKIIFTLILIVFLTSVYIHGSAKDIPLSDVEKELNNLPEIETMQKSGDRELLQFMNLKASSYKEYLYYQGTEALSVEELLIIKTNNKDELSNLKDAVETRIESQIKLFESYGPVQVSMLKNAIISTKGNYLFYCTSKNAEKYKEVLFNAI